VPHTVFHPTVSDPGHLLSVHTVTDPRPGRVAVEVVGEADSRTAPALDVCLRSQAGRPGVRELVVDLTGVIRLVVRTGGRRAELYPLRLTGHPGVVDPDERGRRPVPGCEEQDVVAAARQ
jgi:hypothetical protein